MITLLSIKSMALEIRNFLKSYWFNSNNNSDMPMLNNTSHHSTKNGDLRVISPQNSLHGYVDITFLLLPFFFLHLWWEHWGSINSYFEIFFSLFYISWRLITSQYCSGFCHTLIWISHGLTCVPHPEPPFHLPPHPIPLGHPSAPAPSTCLMHPTWAGDLFHNW